MRLNSPHDFKRCFMSGTRVKNKAFTLHYSDNGGLPARLGINIAKKKVKRAVDRNKIKTTEKSMRFKPLCVPYVCQNGAQGDEQCAKVEPKSTKRVPKWRRKRHKYHQKDPLRKSIKF